MLAYGQHNFGLYGGKDPQTKPSPQFRGLRTQGWYKQTNTDYVSIYEYGMIWDCMYISFEVLTSIVGQIGTLLILGRFLDQNVPKLHFRLPKN